MSSSRGKRYKGRFLDVYFHQKNKRFKRLFFWRNLGEVNLRPRFLKPYQFFILIGLLIISGAVFSANKIFTRAEIIDFYPATCLGVWQAPENAQGEPENFQFVFNSASSSFTSDNSAVLMPGERGEIFCGQFLPNDKSYSGDIKSVGLTLVWNFEGEFAVLPPEFNGTYTIGGDFPDLIDDIEQEDESTGESDDGVGEGDAVDSSFRFPFLNLALAQEETSTEGIQPADEDQEEISGEVVVPEVVPEDEVPTESTTYNASTPPSPQDSNQTSSIVGEGENLDEASEEMQEMGGVEEAEEVIDLNDNGGASSILQGNDGQDDLDFEGGVEEEGDVSKEQEPEVIPTEDAILEVEEEIDEKFLEVQYSFDGQQWLRLAKIDQYNWKSFTATLPSISWDELRKLQIRIMTIETALNEAPKVFLDGMFVEIQYDLPPIFGADKETNLEEAGSDNGEVGVEYEEVDLRSQIEPLPVGKEGRDFSPDESPRFEFNLEEIPAIPASSTASTSVSFNKPNSDFFYLGSRIWSGINTPGELALGGGYRDFSDGGYFLGRFFSSIASRVGNNVFLRQASAQGARGHPKVGPDKLAAAEVFDPNGNLAQAKPFLLVMNNKIQISVPEPDVNFRPGKYKLKLWVYQNNTVYFTETDFTWGVLVVNFNKAEYEEGERALVGVGVLDDFGHTICDAEVWIKVRTASGSSLRFSTVSGDVFLSNECGPQTVTNQADYYTRFKLSELGEYEVTVTADTANGIREIKDSFRVVDNLDFSVERIGPTRIFPPATYKMAIKVIAGEDMSVNFKEALPAGFTAFSEEWSDRSFRDSVQEISWDVELKKGETKELSYFFDAPDISPEIFKLGPTRIFSGGALTWEEGRNWQIASDAAGEIILLWEGAIIPDGWDCISCDSGDPFLDVFPRASSTYGAASSSIHTSKHNLTFFADAGPSITANLKTVSGDIASGDHTHSWANVSSTQDDIRPLYRGLKFIRSSTTTIPNGAIGMFDVASSSLPSDWSYYTDIENRYLAGTSTVGDGGASSHTHTNINSITSSGTSPTGVVGKITRATDTDVAREVHSHSISSGNSLNASDNNPPFVALVFGQTLATTTLGSGSDGLIAMFDNTSLPSDWAIVSTSGSVYADKLILASSTFGATGGSATHDHGASVTFTSGAGSASANKESGTNIVGALGSHTHDVVYLVSSESSIPIYRYVILGKYTAPESLGVSNVVLNNGGDIVLTAYTTTSVSVAASTTGSNFEFATGTIYRSGVGFSCSADDLNCYQIPSSSCAFSGAASSSVTCTAQIWYFADATDASSSYAAQDWQGRITITDSNSASASGVTASGEELLTLVAIEISTSSVNYGSVRASSTTGLANKVVSVINAGNSSTSFKVSGTALTFGSNIVVTSSQHYATSSFNYGEGEPALSDTATAVSGLVINKRTTSSTNPISSWANTTALPVGMSRGVAMAYNGYLYFLGGFSLSPIGGTTTVLYAPISSDGTVGSWTNTTALPSALYDHAGAVYNGYVYLSGGRISSNTSTVIYAPINSNGTIGSWINTTALPTTRRYHAMTAGNNGYMYVTGGEDPTNNPTSTVIYAPINSDGSLGDWEEGNALPDVSYFHHTLVNKDFIYNVPAYFRGGSFVTSSVVYARLNSDGSLMSWTNTTAFPWALFRQGSVLSGDYIYNVAGKADTTDTGNPTTTVTFGKINSAGAIESWIETTAFPSAMLSHDRSTVSYKGFVYVLGGDPPGSDAVTTTVSYGSISSGNSVGDIFWGVGVSAGKPTGTYSGVNTLQAVFEP